MLLAIALSYVLVRGSEHMLTGPDVSLNVALARRDAYGSDFMWFKKDGREYLIRDAVTLDRLDRLFEPARAYKPEAKRVKRELRPLERRESELDRQIDALTDRDEGPRLTTAEEDRLRDLRRELAGVQRDLRTLEQQEEEIDRKRDALEADAERRMLPILEEAVRRRVATAVQ
jgi:phage shock protein A